MCYLAERLAGVIHEGVLRGVRRAALSRRTLSAHHAVSAAITTRELTVIDLVHEPGVHGLELADITQRPNFHAKLAPTGGLVYELTQRLTERWLAANRASSFPVPGGRVDGILYVSRFTPIQRCLAVWDMAKHALAWQRPVRLGEHPALETTLAEIGIGLLD